MDTELVAVTESTDSINIQDLKRKMKVSGRVVKTTLAGAVVDIGVTVPGVIHISQLQAEATNRVEDVVQPGQEVEVWIKRVDLKKNRIELTMIPPLDLEWREIEKGMYHPLGWYLKVKSPAWKSLVPSSILEPNARG
jgi:transcriptional accessory protein Tex/SPT6